jgi:hypothetical protein
MAENTDQNGQASDASVDEQAQQQTGQQQI